MAGEAMKTGKHRQERVHDGFGDWMRNRREHAKYGLRELARLMPASASYLSRLETGSETSPPSEEFLDRWSDFVGVRAYDACWHARRIPHKIARYLTSKWDGPALAIENNELREALLALYRLHCPATAEDKLRYDTDTNGWNAMLFGVLKSAQKVLGIDREAEWKVINEEMDALQREDDDVDELVPAVVACIECQHRAECIDRGVDHVCPPQEDAR
jgi:transcriptional regulator with XRE-family HTH domain